MGGRGAMSHSGGLPDHRLIHATVKDEAVASGPAMQAFLNSKIQSVYDYPELEGQVYRRLHTVTTGKITGASGLYNRAEMKIVVDSRLSPKAQREVMAHELGHALAIDPPRGFRSDVGAFTSAFAEYKKANSRASEASFAAKISNYATKARGEAFAEAFKDVSVNGKNASPASLLIMKHWKK